ncbi:MAG: type II toxin-antitoxin system RelE/ParE family toxin [Sulfuricella sp.]|nr:type II toxin-antitoxin system RelE/ParE family toxin [Sulfuricella sp.]
MRISRSAEQDLLNGFAFYESNQEGVGSYFLDSLYAEIDALALYGGIHPKPDGRLHRALARRFPFAIYYERRDDEILVIAILDCRQNPASITKRIKSQQA